MFRDKCHESPNTQVHGYLAPPDIESASIAPRAALCAVGDAPLSVCVGGGGVHAGGGGDLKAKFLHCGRTAGTLQ